MNRMDSQLAISHQPRRTVTVWGEGGIRLLYEGHGRPSSLYASSYPTDISPAVTPLYSPFDFPLVFLRLK